MRDGASGRSGPRPLTVIRRTARWQPRTYVQIWAMAVASYLVCELAYRIFAGWPRQPAVAFVTAAVIWVGIGISQSYYLHRRRTD
jgi:hypothetical protein